MTTLNPTLTRPGTLADLIPGSGAVAIARDAGLVIGGAALTGLAAQVSILIPSISPVVPFTMQTLAVLLVGASLGAVRGALSMGLYLIVGLAGVPWFAQQTSGFEAAKATMGYLVGFIVAAAVVGLLSSRGNDRRFLSSTAEMYLGTLIVYACGLPVLMQVTGMDLGQTLKWGLYPFVITDTLKVLAAAGLLPLAWKIVTRVRGDQQT